MVAIRRVPKLPGYSYKAPHFPGTGGVNETPTTREYHTITRGCILNEILIRVDPQGRTIGEIIKKVSNINANIIITSKN